METEEVKVENTEVAAEEVVAEVAPEVVAEEAPAEVVPEVTAE